MDGRALRPPGDGDGVGAFDGADGWVGVTELSTEAGTESIGGVSLVVELDLMLSV
jgi:hypothetical protein